MSDELTPEQDAVRRLLAQARHDAPAPDEVVARLDDALAWLVAERGAAPLPAAEADRAPVVDLGARRRRRVGVALLAAAAVVVGGVALGQGLPSGSGDAGSASAGGDMATSQEDAPSDERDASDSAGGAESQATSPQAKQATSVPTLSTSDDHLAQELRRLEPRTGARRNPLTLDAPDAFCVSGIGPGRRLAAEVNDQPGVVIYRPRSGDAQQVALYICGDGEAVLTLFLPLP